MGLEGERALLLYPAELVPVREGQHRWELRLHGPPNLNESLAQTLARLCGVGLSLDELLQEDDDRVFALDAPTYKGIGACLRRLGLPVSGEALPDHLASLEPRNREAREGAERDQFQLRHHLVLGRFPAAASSEPLLASASTVTRARSFSGGLPSSTRPP